MRKIVFILMLSIAAFSGVKAQGFDPRFFNNQFLTLGGGVTMYSNDAGITSGSNFEFSVGNWILSDMALRFDFGMMSAENARGYTSNFYNGHADFMWDAIGTITGVYDPKRVVSVYPEVGFGFIIRQGYMRPANMEDTSEVNHMNASGEVKERFDPDFMAMVGAMFEFRIPRLRQMPLFIDAKMFILPQDYDFNSKQGKLFDITFGIKREINYDPTHKRLPGESRAWNYDWFCGVAAGPNFSVVPSEGGALSVGGRFGWNADVTFGRNFSSLWSVRFGISAMSGTTERVVMEGFDPEAYDYMFFGARADLMFNVGNINGFRRGRRFNLLPYAGCGLIERFDQKRIAMGADAGLIARFYITSTIDLYADARYMMVPPRFSWGQHMLDNGYGLINFGFTYNFEPSSCRYAKAAFRLKN